LALQVSLQTDAGFKQEAHLNHAPGKHARQKARLAARWPLNRPSRNIISGFCLQPQSGENMRKTWLAFKIIISLL
jgi:hypothetical protein